MKSNVKLGSRECEVLECIAWGASQKETASFLGIAPRTVDNTVRKIKLKTGMQKAAELSAYWFCTHFDISFDLSPLIRMRLATVMLVFFLFTGIDFKSDPIYTRCNRRARIEIRVLARTREIDISNS
ncbi:LuxR C-terminal-related transcriptional regulator [Bacteroides sp. UBA939]|uniref:LuxR C-terminal-related transcriptional regulator n=1 Tax=Bacteroides sp. UBA939 TaxID=1946092 RepID=UPI0025C3B6B1|nr:LuxR C-terminal-related transcriptional regulator [Bacteroides sp. UBA939]